MSKELSHITGEQLTTVKLTYYTGRKKILCRCDLVSQIWEQ